MTPASALPRGGLARYAIAAAVSVGVINLTQPLLTLIGADLGVDATATAASTTAMQIGYALGVLFLVSMSDRTRTRRQVELQSAATVVLLCLAALSPNLPVLCVLVAAAGATATTAQVLLPSALRASDPATRGRTTSIMVGSFMLGIFGTRIAAGFLGDLVGWRWTFVAVAGITLVAGLLVRSAVPATRPTASTVPYVRILTRLPGLFWRTPGLRVSALAQFCTFAAFQALWVTLVLQMTDEPHSWSVGQAGLLGVVGLAAGAFTVFTGWFVDRWGASVVVRICVAAGLVVALALVPGQDVVPLIAAALFVLSAANQTAQVGNQSVALSSVDPSNTGSANTVFMFIVFLGGSFGSAAGSVAYGIGDFAGVAALAAGLFAIALGLVAHGATRPWRDGARR